MRADRSDPSGPCPAYDPGVEPARTPAGADVARARPVQLAAWLLALAVVALAVLWWRGGTLDALGASAVAAAGVLAAVVLSAVAELRARSRLRRAWLARLHRLTEELSRVVEAPDAVARVRAAEVTATTGIRAPQAMERERAAFLRSVADLCQQALRRLEVQEAERRARADLELLARAQPRLTASLDVARIAETIRDLVVPDLAARCELRVHGHGDEPEPADEVGDAVVPIVDDDGAALGDIVLWGHGGVVDARALQTVRVLAEPARHALAHALRFQDELRTSLTLQDSLLPRAVLPVPGLEIATRYLSATEGQLVGGDFYDVVRRRDGSVLLVVGDVQGKGIEAATLTSACRHTLRAAALDGAGPAAMLRRANAALLYADEERLTALGAPTVRFVTASVVELTPAGDGFQAVVASGGHPPPVRIQADGAVELLEADGPLLGVFPDARFEERPLALGPGDLVVLYTDGVTERRTDPELFDEHQLGRFVRNQLAARRADVVAQQILDTVVDLSPRETRDDIALVVARVQGRAAR